MPQKKQSFAVRSCLLSISHSTQGMCFAKYSAVSVTNVVHKNHAGFATVSKCCKPGPSSCGSVLTFSAGWLRSALSSPMRVRNFVINILKT